MAAAQGLQTPRLLDDSRIEEPVGAGDISWIGVLRARRGRRLGRQASRASSAGQLRPCHRHPNHTPIAH
jgi:hypothetical protein